MARNFNFGYIAHLSAWRKHKVEVQQAAATKAVASAATAYAARPSLYNRLMLCNAVIDLIDDGDSMAEREVLMDELRCDEGGNPLPPDDCDDTYWRDSCSAIRNGMGEAA